MNLKDSIREVMEARTPEDRARIRTEIEASAEAGKLDPETEFYLKRFLTRSYTDVAWRVPKVFYLCDGTNPFCKKSKCGVRGEGECTRTSDIRFARNFGLSETGQNIYEYDGADERIEPVSTVNDAKVRLDDLP